ncbi:redoxin domain-containing protein [Oceanotoga sp. DSM 15011]|jgi:peroxiredoxin|uniref:Peroxiredoxin n=1 Tax=Oceanotoga teriensis TaxID=515440 RepID=A0AA45C7T4_9BACT|nr:MULTISPECIES: redoxin domain-containing protein [Oceanotoga]MDN5343395.1 hypothetical protein [Oceanotoga sp.]MDO7976300.1 redoxin domain-containing protein [Oceanotoga teriensis]PWJ95497.1 peroxiredoxin [Oceanotoga teriensis]UYP01136.1 redoxin domain-containing protein [Oceanotoga sp. DSM 15011]
MELKIGEKAPNFKILDQDEKIFELNDFKGKKILLSFHPFAWTPVCETQMKNLDIKHDEFENYNVIPIGISVDSAPCKAAWGKELKLKKLKLGSDFWPHGKIGKDYNLFFDEKGFDKRANVLIDEDGKVIWMKEYELLEQPNLSEIFDFLKK